MVDAPDRIWSIGSESPYRINCSILDHSGEPGCTEYVRADIAASQLAEKQKQLDELPSKALWDESRKALASMRNEVGELKRQLAEARAEAETMRQKAISNAKERNAAEAERDRLAADNARLEGQVVFWKGTSASNAEWCDRERAKNEIWCDRLSEAAGRMSWYDDNDCRLSPDDMFDRLIGHVTAARINDHDARVELQGRLDLITEAALDATRKCMAAWAAGEPAHRVKDMIDAIEKLQLLVDPLHGATIAGKE